MKEPPDTNIQVVYHDSDTNTEYVSTAYCSPSLRAIYSRIRVFKAEREGDTRGHAFTVHSLHIVARQERPQFDRLTFLEAFFFQMPLLYH